MLIAKIRTQQINFVLAAAILSFGALGLASSFELPAPPPSEVVIGQTGVKIGFSGSNVFLHDPRNPDLRFVLQSKRFHASDSPADDLAVLGATAVNLASGISLLALEEGITIFVVTEPSANLTHIWRTVDGARMFLISDESSEMPRLVYGIDAEGRTFARRGLGRHRPDATTLKEIRQLRAAYVESVHSGDSFSVIKNKLRLEPTELLVIEPPSFQSERIGRISVFSPRPRLQAMSTRDLSAQMAVPSQVIPVLDFPGRAVASFPSGRVAVGELTAAGGLTPLYDLVAESRLDWSLANSWLQPRTAPSLRFEHPDFLIATSANGEVKIPIADLTRSFCRGFTQAQML